MAEKFETWADDLDFVSWLRENQFKTAGPIKWRNLVNSAGAFGAGGNQSFLIKSMWTAWVASHETNGDARRLSVSEPVKWTHASESPPDDYLTVFLFRATGGEFRMWAGVCSNGKLPAVFPWDDDAVLIGWYSPDTPPTDNRTIEKLLEDGGPIYHDGGAILTYNQQNKVIIDGARNILEGTAGEGVSDEDLMTLSRSLSEMALAGNRDAPPEARSHTKKSAPTARDKSKKKRRKR